MSRGKELDKKEKLRLPQSAGAKKGGESMKGYLVPSGYMGFVNGRYMLFATEHDYYEYITE